MRALIFASAFAATAALAVPASAQSAANVLVVVNADSPDSVRVGEYYAEKRGVPANQLVRINAALTDGIERTEYLRTIEAPVARWLARHRLQDDIWFIVLTKGVPLRINGTGDRGGTLASVDSELTLLYRKLVGETPPLVGRVENPLFLGERPVAEARRFTRRTSDLYLVTRLDGFTADDAMGLVDRALAPSRTGTIVLDERAVFGDRGGDGWLDEAANRITEERDDAVVLHETTRAAAATPEPVIGYYSWGSNDASNERRGSGLTFAPGAVGAMFLSNDGRTFTAPPDDWRPTDASAGRGRMYAGSFQSLAGDLVREGITGVAAHVAEPFLDATIRPQVLFPVYLAGFNLAESFYMAMPFLSWRTVVIGDPLAAPFPGTAIDDAEFAAGVDEATELPTHFAARRLAWMADGGLDLDAVRLLLRVESRLARDEDAEVEPILVAATSREPRLIVAHMRLASMYEGREDYPKAAERYRAILDADEDHVVALNNLAYLLAERQNAPEEALPLARRAYRLSPIPTVADTLAWALHLSGDDKAALPLVTRAVEGAPGNVDIQVHAAAIHAALGNRLAATQALEAARKLDPALAERPGVAEIEARIAAIPNRPRPRGNN